MVRPETPRITKVPELRKGDTVVVLSGKDAGKRGVVERIFRDPRGRMLGSRRSSRNVTPLAETSVVVTGLNIAKRHTKPRPPSSAQMTTGRVPASQHGGILDIAQPLAISKVMLVCSRCDQPTRIAHATLDNGTRVRVCRNCGEQLEAKS